MFPLGHLGVAVLLVEWRGYEGRTAVLCLLGAYFPDIVDKPLGMFGVVPSLHTVAHSVLLVVPLAAVAAWTGRGEPFVLGWLSHVAADLPLAVPTYLDHYVWPVLAPPAPPQEPLPAYVARYATTPWFALELCICALALGVVLRNRTAA